MSEFTDSLMRAGVGRRYYDARLSQMGKPGTDLLRWVDDQMDAQLEVGGGLNIYGDGEAANALTQALTRLLVLMEVRCRLMPLTRLLDAIRAEEAPEYQTLLVVSGFYSAGYRSPPLSVRDQMMVEAYIKDRFDRGMCTFTHAGAAPKQWFDWWSTEIVANLVMANLPVQANG